MNNLKNAEPIELLDEELADVSGGKSDAFVMFGDIKGESQQSSHADWVEILDYRH